MYFKKVLFPSKEKYAKGKVCFKGPSKLIYYPDIC